MGKPRELFLPPDARHSGIQIVYTRSRKSLNISGWYDNYVGIEGTEIPLRDFLISLGIRAVDCQKALAGWCYLDDVDPAAKRSAVCGEGE